MSPRRMERSSARKTVPGAKSWSTASSKITWLGAKTRMAPVKFSGASPPLTMRMSGQAGNFLDRACAKAQPRRSSPFQFMPMPSTKIFFAPRSCARSFSGKFSAQGNGVLGLSLGGEDEDFLTAMVGLTYIRFSADGGPKRPIRIRHPCDRSWSGRNRRTGRNGCSGHCAGSS